MTDNKTIKDREQERDTVLSLVDGMEFIAEDLSTAWDEGEGTWVFTFSTLHVPQEGEIRVRTWNLASAEARSYFMGLRDGANYAFALTELAAQRREQ